MLLGFPDRMVGAGERLDHYTTKVGGAPDWPPSVSAAAVAAAVEGADAGRDDATPTAVPTAPPEDLTRCPTCSATMALVVQAHAPLGAEPGGEEEARGGSDAQRRPALLRRRTNNGRSSEAVRVPRVTMTGGLSVA